jgi:MFS family permease
MQIRAGSKIAAATAGESMSAQCKPFPPTLIPSVVTALEGAAPTGFLGWRMVFIAACTQNAAVGLTFGSFGALVLAIEQRFATTRTLSTLGVSLTILVLSLGAPTINVLLRSISIRRMMTIGALLAAAGYALLPLAQGIGQFLLLFGLLISPGMLFLGVIPSNILAANWFIRSQGRALGLVTMPVLVMLLPMATSWALERYGLNTVFISLAVGHLLVLPLMPFVIDRPEQVGQLPLGQETVAPKISTVSPISMRTLLRLPVLWLATIGIGIAVGGGILKAAHLIALVTGQGWSLERASFLFALSGGTGILGALAFGWLADKVGAGYSLAANCLVQAVVWFIFLQPVGFGLLLVDAVLVGACGGGLAAAQGVLLNRLFGMHNFARVMGLVTLFTLPFTFGAAPFASALFDATGSYTLPIALQIAAFGVAALIFLYVQRRLPARDVAS